MERRTFLLSSLMAAVAAQQPSAVVEQPVQPKPAPAPSVRLSDEQLVEMHKDAQYLLAQGVTPAALDAQIELTRQICIALDLNVIDDEDVIEKMLDTIHERAFPGPIAPPRLTLEKGRIRVSDNLRMDVTRVPKSAYRPTIRRRWCPSKARNS